MSGKFSILCNSCRDDKEIEKTSESDRSPNVRLEKGGSMEPDKLIVFCHCGNREVYHIIWPFIGLETKRGDEEVE
jgi:hypothetical protein